MSTIPPVYALGLAGVLFVLGLLGVLVRRNIIFVLASDRDHAQRRRAGVPGCRLPLGAGRRSGDVRLHPRRGGG